MGRINRLIQVIRNYGIGFLLYRVWYALERKTGLQRIKFKIRSWEDIDLERTVKESIEALEKQTGSFFFTHHPLPVIAKNDALISAANSILENNFTYFFHQQCNPGDPPDWFISPLTKKHANDNIHWTGIQDLDPGLGDIKYVWEASRFAWVYTLVRAFAATGDDRYVEKFWDLFLNWQEKNLPNRGPHYYCGQECAIRLMALCMAWFAFNGHSSSISQKRQALLKTIYVLAERIEKNIAYAVSTRTNHALTESLGLYTAGILFPGFKTAARWQRKGKKILVREALKQIAVDGSYIQHSMNYHRFMLQCLLWSVRLGQLNRDRFPDELLDRLNAANQFAYQLQDEKTGRVPNYGPNDGALIIPLNNCDYLDYRPVIQAVHYLLHKEKLYDKGPWDEDLLWLFGAESVENTKNSITRVSSTFENGGYFTLRGSQSWGMVRCHTYTTRPSQSDSLHLDVWYRGINILRDSGSYLYNDPGPLKSFFSSTAAHNTVRVDELDQMTRGPRFIWYDWLKAGNAGLQVTDEKIRFSGEHYGYNRLEEGLIHQRTVDLYPEWNIWVIADELKGGGDHLIELFWQLTDAEWETGEQSIMVKHPQAPFGMYFHGPEQMSVAVSKGDEQTLRGFESLYYGERHASPVATWRGKLLLPQRLVTVIVPGEGMVIHREKESLVISNNKGKLTLLWETLALSFEQNREQ